MASTSILRRDDVVVQCTWTPPEQLDLLATDGLRVWRSATATRETLAPFIAAAGLPRDEYYRLTRAAFARDRDGAMRFTVRVDTATEPARIHWQYDVQDVVAGRIAVILGDLPLTREPDDRGRRAMLKLITSLAEEKDDLQLLNERVSAQYRTADGQRTAALADLKAAVAKHSTLEDTLSSKFVALLNSKKRKIRTLMAAIADNGTVQIGDAVFAITAQRTALDMPVGGLAAVAGDADSDVEAGSPPAAAAGSAAQAAPTARSGAGPSGAAGRAPLPTADRAVRAPAAAAAAAAATAAPAAPAAAAVQASTGSKRPAAADDPPAPAAAAVSAAAALMGPMDEPAPIVRRRRLLPGEVGGASAAALDAAPAAAAAPPATTAAAPKLLTARSTSDASRRRRNADGLSINDLVQEL